MRARVRSGPAGLILAALAAVPPAGARAEGRPDTAVLTCAEAAGLVARAGALVLASGPNRYDRVVRDGGFCAIEKITQPEFRPTRDAPSCFVGYRCVDPFSEGGNGP